jgi:hypothetical protein
MDILPKDEWRSASVAIKEIEWFVFNGKFYRRERTGLDAQRLFLGDSGATGAPAAPREFLESREVGAFVARLAPGCNAPIIVAADDNYGISSLMPHAPIYRSVCQDIWYQIDGASGAILERLDPSRRAYRWLYGALHTMDIPVLVAHPVVRSVLIVLSCGFGFVFLSQPSLSAGADWGSNSLPPGCHGQRHDPGISIRHVSSLCLPARRIATNRLTLVDPGDPGG